MRILISGGGTGGHVYPALVVADALKTIYKDAQILYVGSSDGMEKEIVARTDLLYRAVDAGQVRGMSPWTLFKNLGRLWQGYRQGHNLLVEWPADAILVTGGYVTVPMALAAWRRHIPVMIYLPDLEPGWAIRFMSRFADRIAVSFDEVSAWFPKHKVWTSGYPVRTALFDANRNSGYETLGLNPGIKTLLVFGGSRGARSINRAVGTILHDLLARYQVIHVSGQLDWVWIDEKRRELAPELQKRYRAYPYLHDELPAAFAVADLVVARAGAATLAEWPAVGLPSILVPYPYSGQHQQKNADFMVAHGAAVCVNDSELETQLKSVIDGLLEDELALQKMGERARALFRPDAARKLASELVRLAHLREEQHNDTAN
ncbi:MAG: undecaprenyldiphospho-muramoylpentapeptide beta-N-acetylglucosaminyltransferase [Anaerolineae bacterium]|nr:undecaprenyldiphospho-muramoylpentapeptide beta-N-acetylglucosaminyltransferase [Anaerolineae bacterium]